MIISKIYPTEFKAKYVPLAEHKGPLLKLTEAEEKRILRLNVQKEQLEEKLSAILDEIEKFNDANIIEKYKLTNARNKIYDELNKIEKNILNIKKNRIRIQKEEFKSTNI